MLQPFVSKTDAEKLAENIRREIRAGTFQALPGPANANNIAGEEKHDVCFEMFARRFIERYSKERGKASWQDPTKALDGRHAHAVGIALGTGPDRSRALHARREPRSTCRRSSVERSIGRV